MSINEGKAVTNGTGTKGPAPWEYRPLRAMLRLPAYFAVVFAMLGFMNAVMLAVGVAWRVIPSAQSAMEALAGVAWWLVIAAAGIFCVWVFAMLNRRLTLPRYMKKCPPGAIYCIRRPVIKSFTKTGYVRFADHKMELEGTLSPNFLWPILVFAVLNTFFILLMFTGGPIIFLGGLDGLLLLLVYGYIFKRKTRLTINQIDVEAVKCKGPVIKIVFRKEAQLPVGSLTILLPPDGRVEFLKNFDMTFPGKLPADYRAALEKEKVLEQEVHNRDVDDEKDIEKTVTLPAGSGDCLVTFSQGSLPGLLVVLSLLGVQLYHNVAAADTPNVPLVTALYALGWLVFLFNKRKNVRGLFMNAGAAGKDIRETVSFSDDGLEIAVEGLYSFHTCWERLKDYDIRRRTLIIYLSGGRKIKLALDTFSNEEIESIRELLNDRLRSPDGGGTGGVSLPFCKEVERRAGERKPRMLRRTDAERYYFLPAILLILGVELWHVFHRPAAGNFGFWAAAASMLLCSMNCLMHLRKAIKDRYERGPSGEPMEQRIHLSKNGIEAGGAAECTVFYSWNLLNQVMEYKEHFSLFLLFMREMCVNVYKKYFNEQEIDAVRELLLRKLHPGSQRGECRIGEAGDSGRRIGVNGQVKGFNSSKIEGYAQPFGFVVSLYAVVFILVSFTIRSDDIRLLSSYLIIPGVLGIVLKVLGGFIAHLFFSSSMATASLGAGILFRGDFNLLFYAFFMMCASVAVFITSIICIKNRVGYTDGKNGGAKAGIPAWLQITLGILWWLFSISLTATL